MKFEKTKNEYEWKLELGKFVIYGSWEELNDLLAIMSEAYKI